ncbi:MAG: hypothetical protein N4A61_10690 [Pelagimonas sp.]|nr:hypothetical protein [Pelagimonas sp.]
MTDIPPIDVLMTPPETCKTIYVWKPSVMDSSAFPLERSENIGAFHREQAGFPVAHEDTIVKLPGLPDSLYVFRQASFEGREDLFSAVEIQTETLPRALPEGLLVYGSPVLRADFCDVIRAVDPEGGHQFIPCAVTMPDGSPASDQAYFHFVCGRRVGAGGDVTLDFDSLRADYLPTMVRDTLINIDTARALADVPVWSSVGNETPLFLSQAIWDEVQARGLSGLKEFSAFGGELPENHEDLPETIGHVWVAA